eukprot:3370854-Pyramimonas_sp.AAC.1
MPSLAISLMFSYQSPKRLGVYGYPFGCAVINRGGGWLDTGECVLRGWFSNTTWVLDWRCSPRVKREELLTPPKIQTASKNRLT